MDGEVAPSDVEFPNWEHVILDEDSHDGNTIYDWEFTRQGIIYNNVQVSQSRRDNTFDLTSDDHHIYN